MKKIGLLALAIVLSLGLLGVGLAQWTETLTIEGDVETGEVDFEFISVKDNDNGNDPGKDRDVGDCVVELKDTDTDSDYDLAVVTITNAYPSYNVRLTVMSHNNGTLPVDFYMSDTVIIDNPYPNVTVSLWSWCEPPEPSEVPEGYVVVDENTSNPITLKPCDGLYWPIKIHVEEGAAEYATYTFTIAHKVRQFGH